MREFAANFGTPPEAEVGSDAATRNARINLETLYLKRMFQKGVGTIAVARVVKYGGSPIAKVGVTSRLGISNGGVSSGTLVPLSDASARGSVVFEAKNLGSWGSTITIKLAPAAAEERVVGVMGATTTHVDITINYTEPGVTDAITVSDVPVAPSAGDVADFNEANPYVNMRAGVTGEVADNIAAGFKLRVYRPTSAQTYTMAGAQATTLTANEIHRLMGRSGTDGTPATAPSDADVTGSDGDGATRRGLRLFGRLGRIDVIAVPSNTKRTTATAVRKLAATYNAIGVITNEGTRTLDNFITDVSETPSRNICPVWGRYDVRDENTRMRHTINPVGDVAAIMASVWAQQGTHIAPFNQDYSQIAGVIRITDATSVYSRDQGEEREKLTAAGVNWLNVNQAGEVIFWGNRTTENPSKQTSKLNVVGIANGISEFLRIQGLRVVGKQNTNSTWALLRERINREMQRLTNVGALESSTLIDDSNADISAANPTLNVNTLNDLRNGIYRVRLQFVPVSAIEQVILDLTVNNAEDAVTVTQV